MEQKRGDERAAVGEEEMKKMDCQERKKPEDRDHGEGMDGRGLGMTCETSREGGEKMESICSLYLLRSRMHDHNPLIAPQAFPGSFYVYDPPRVFPSLSLSVSFPL